MTLSRLRDRVRTLLFGAVAERSEDAQRRVNEACRELTLFHYPACPFCIRVNRALKRLALPLGRLNIHEDRAALAELQSAGGKAQVPCLRIARQGQPVRWLYESGDIVRYLEGRFPP